MNRLPSGSWDVNLDRLPDLLRDRQDLAHVATPDELCRALLLAVVDREIGACQRCAGGEDHGHRALALADPGLQFKLACEEREGVWGPELQFARLLVGQSRRDRDRERRRTRAEARNCSR